MTDIAREAWEREGIQQAIETTNKIRVLAALRRIGKAFLVDEVMAKQKIRAFPIAPGGPIEADLYLVVYPDGSREIRSADTDNWRTPTADQVYFDDTPATYGG